jgi:hypothetical protein
VEYGTVHKSSIPIEVLQKLPFIIIQEKDLPAEVLEPAAQQSEQRGGPTHVLHM